MIIITYNFVSSTNIPSSEIDLFVVNCLYIKSCKIEQGQNSNIHDTVGIMDANLCLEL